MSISQAYKDFQDTLELAKALLEMEKAYPDPAPSDKRKPVEGLRGGAAVLMVAAFESFLKGLVEELLDEMTVEPLKFQLSDVPEEMLFYNLDQYIDLTKRRKKEPRIDVINAYQQMARSIVAGIMIPESFTDAVRSNPDAKKVNELFKRFGIKNFYKAIQNDFEHLWNSPIADSFIQDTLDNILDRRHKVAHTASVLNISRKDLQESLRFLEVLGDVCEKCLSEFIGDILNPPSKSNIS